jgi:D-tyrosyl-tRNA(Tyr) deacylase
MRVVIQRVRRAGVFVGESRKGEIDSGFLILVGFGKSDTIDIVNKLCTKILKLRIMQDSDGKMNKTLEEEKASILLISQFTLYRDEDSGNRPSFFSAADPSQAKLLYDECISFFQKTNVHIETGVFGEHMDIQAELSGPVTIVLEE